MTPTAEYGTPIDRQARSVGFLAHEFGHVDDAAKLGGVEWERQNALIKKQTEGIQKMGAPAYFRSNEYKALVRELGDTPANVDQAREERAEAYAIPVIKEYYGKGAGNGSIPGRVKTAIQDYEKTHPK